MHEWTWDPDDFAALWYSDANDRFPNPLHYQSSFVLRDEFAAHAVAVRNRYSRDEMERIQLAVHTLTTSDMRIEILGGTMKHKGRDGRVRMYRIVGARNPYHAVTLTQTATVDLDGPIRLRMCRPADLPGHIAKSIPAREPGREKPATFHVGDLQPRRTGHFEETSRGNPREQYQRLLQRPADGGGSAGLLTGPINTVSQPWNVLQWHDITDDGRYLERRSGDQISVRPVTAQELSAHFTAWIDRALQRLRADEDETW
ncbi:ESX secretion-associated protein EspG [Nocardia sp. NBC_01499]|uniref:ESX secretion-associated protein EspG n=1 Tax=Nocardia sp. NBC_01499 TaxID=2903597 RepID=UPI0038704B17